jgi:hypothetical protein
MVSMTSKYLGNSVSEAGSVSVQLDPINFNNLASENDDCFQLRSSKSRSSISVTRPSDVICTMRTEGLYDVCEERVFAGSRGYMGDCKCHI